MTLLVDTSVWSLALRRDIPPDSGPTAALADALEAGEALVSTGIVLQELLQGFNGPKARDTIVDRFRDVPFVVPDREDHVEAAELRNRCRRAGVQIGTIDALLAQLCIRRGLTILTADRDFERIAAHAPLKVRTG